MIQAILDAGFVFWGVFVVDAAVLTGYVVWMWRAER